MLTFSSQLIAAIKRRAGMAPSLLLDVQTADGTVYYFSDREQYAQTAIPTSTRIQTVGGTNVSKYYYSIGVSVSGLTYELRCVIKNQGAGTVKLHPNLGTGVTIKPGMEQVVNATGVGNGATFVQFQILAGAAGDSIDIEIADPYIGIVGHEQNLISSANRDFSGWTAFAGAAVTLTQNQSGKRKYSPKLKSAGPFRFSLDTSSDAGDVTIENLSGNSVQRYLSHEFRTREFFHALAVLRVWQPVVGEALREFHAVIKEPLAGPEEMTCRLVQISDPTQYSGPYEITSEQCGVRYKGPYCASASGLATCPRTIPACSTRGAVEHFSGVPFPPPATTFPATIGN